MTSSENQEATAEQEQEPVAQETDNQEPTEEQQPASDAPATEEAAPESSEQAQAQEPATADPPAADANDDEKVEEPANEEEAKANTEADDIKEEPKPKGKVMRAWMCSAFGDPKEVLKLVDDAPYPTLTKPTNLIVRVYYASMNPVEYKTVTGLLGVVSPSKPPFIVGHDFSGVVVAAGASVDQAKFKVGQAVYGQGFMQHGSWAEFVEVQAAATEPIPGNISFMDAASIPLVAITAYQALITIGKCNKKSKLLIFGGSTACGLIGTQIARAVGCAEVAVTSSSVELCESVGATRVVNYKESKWETELKDEKFDIVFDCVGGVEAWDNVRANRVIAEKGMYVTIVGDGGGNTKPITAGNLISAALSMGGRKFKALLGYEKYHFFLADRTKNLEDVGHLVARAKIRPMLDSSSPYTFEQGVDVYEKCMAHTAKGKLVMKIFDDGERVLTEPIVDPDPEPEPVLEEEEEAKDPNSNSNADDVKAPEEPAEAPAEAPAEPPAATETAEPAAPEAESAEPASEPASEPAAEDNANSAEYGGGDADDSNADGNADAPETADT